MFVDSHAHLTSKDFESDRDEVIRRALDAGVDFIVNPGTSVADSRRAIELAQKYPQVYACVGIHPHEARSADRDALRELEELSRQPKVVAVGEIGLDYHYDFSPRDVQIRLFEEQLALAAERSLPVVIHTREAMEDTLRAVDAVIAKCPAWRGPASGTASGRSPGARGVFHCFPGDASLALKLIADGFYVSLPGIVTFKNNGNAADVASKVSPEHLLLETDSPYLAPVPHRGKRNEPSYIPLIAGKIASLQQLAPEDIGRATSYNVFRLFGIGTAGTPCFTYMLKNALYVNLTNRCNADCVFCDRKGDAVIKGHNLRIEREPTPAEILKEIGDPQKYSEIVFCGYGEPTIRLEEMKEIARWVKSRGGKTRLNTDGHGSIINKRNIVPELSGVIDAVSISLNSTDPAQYGELMRLDGTIFFPAMVAFAREAVRVLPKVVMTVVDIPEVDKEKARQLVEDEIGAIFSTRPYF